MGTRHTVKVILNNKTVLNQYGQWDGYIDYAGMRLYKYLKNCDIDKFKTICSNLIEADLRMAVSFNDIAEYLEKKAYKRFEQNIYEEDAVSVIVTDLMEKFGYERATAYLLLTRDTGYKIFETLEAIWDIRPDVKLPVVLVADECYWNYSVNLDDNTFTLIKGNQSMKFNLDKLPEEDTMYKLCYALENYPDEKMSKGKRLHFIAEEYLKDQIIPYIKIEVNHIEFTEEDKNGLMLTVYDITEEEYQKVKDTNPDILSETSKTTESVNVKAFDISKYIER